MNRIKINFRSKFLKVITKENKEAIIHAFQKFLLMTEPEALEILWRLTYLRGEEYLEDDLRKLGLDFYMIPLENIKQLRNELRYKYQQLYPSFLKPYIEDEGATEALLVLNNKADEVSAYVVCEVILSKIGRVDLDRALFLLESDNEKYYFGGIRSLGFSWDEANYLKPYHAEIANLLRALRLQEEMLDEYDEPIRPIRYVEETAPIRDEAIDTEEAAQIHDEAIDADETAPIHDKATNAEEHYVDLSPEEVLKNKQGFEKLLKNLDAIEGLGYDLNEVVEKLDLIRELIDVARRIQS